MIATVDFPCDADLSLQAVPDRRRRIPGLARTPALLAFVASLSDWLLGRYWTDEGTAFVGSVAVNENQPAVAAFKDTMIRQIDRDLKFACEELAQAGEPGPDTATLDDCRSAAKVLAPYLAGVPSAMVMGVADDDETASIIVDVDARRLTIQFQAGLPGSFITVDEHGTVRRERFDDRRIEEFASWLMAP